MMKRLEKFLLGAALALVLLVALLPGGAAAATVVASGTCGATGSNLKWKLDSDGVLTISGEGAMANTEVYTYAPWCIAVGEGSICQVVLEPGVTSIGDNAFYNCSDLISISIPDSVTSIGCRAFASCNCLASITIPESVTYIGSDAFYGCTSLLSAGQVGSGCNIEFGWTESIPDFAFYGSSLTCVTLPVSMSSIGNYAFENCWNLTSVTIPKGLTSIGNYSFYYCTSLESITIPDSVTRIGIEAFHYCTALANVYYDGTATQRNGIHIASNNAHLTSATWHYGCVTVSFNANTVDVLGTMDAQTISADTPTALTACAFTRDGYTFTGWNTEPDGSGTAYADGQSVTLTEDLTLYAQWEKASPAAIRSVKSESISGLAACRAVIDCGEGCDAVAWAVRYDGGGRFLGFEALELEAGENDFIVLRQNAAVIRFYVLDSSTWVPLCEAADAPAP